MEDAEVGYVTSQFFSHALCVRLCTNGGRGGGGGTAPIGTSSWNTVGGFSAGKAGWGSVMELLCADESKPQSCGQVTLSFTANSFLSMSMSETGWTLASYPNMHRL